MAKAYARAPVLTVNGSDDGFDGFRYWNGDLVVIVAVIPRGRLIDELGVSGLARVV